MTKTSLFAFFLAAFSFSAAQAQRVYINDGGICTNRQEVTLQIDVPNAKEMMISNVANFAGAKWEPVKPNKNWKLNPTEGKQTVYVKIKDTKGAETTLSDDIKLDTKPPVATTIRINNGATESQYPDVTLTFDAKEADKMWISNSPKFDDGGTWELYSENKEWTMGGIEGKQTVYAKFKDSCENESAVITGKILLVK